MAVVATYRSVIWRGAALRRRSDLVRMELTLSLVKLGVIGLLILTGAAVCSISMTPLCSMTNSITGIRISYPADWEYACCAWLCCHAARKECDWSWNADCSRRLGDPAVRFLVVPLDPRATEGWADALPPRRDLVRNELLPAIVAGFGFVQDSRVRVRNTRLLGASAIEVTGPRTSGYWGQCCCSHRGGVPARLRGGIAWAFLLPSFHADMAAHGARSNG
jgi:hypothetical protein